MNVLITLLGRSVRGLVNSAWASMRTYDFIPDRIHIIDACIDGSSAEEAVRQLQALLQGFDTEAKITVERVRSCDIGSIASAVREIMGIYRVGDHSLAIDVTSGTKDLVLGTLMNSMSSVEHIFYLRIDSLRNADRPHILIPIERQRSIDVLAEVRS